MTECRAKLLEDMSNAVVEMDEQLAVTAAQRFVDEGFNPYEAVECGLAHGMDRAGQLYEEEEYYIPELLMCSDAMYAGIDTLRPHFKNDASAEKSKVVIGVVQGDTHDIGKNLVKIMLETAGFDVTDLGRDVPPQDFVDKAKEIHADIIVLSTLMTTTMEGMEDVVARVKAEDLSDRVRVMVGGGPISPGFAQRIGAHYSEDASKAAKLAKRLIREENA